MSKVKISITLNENTLHDIDSIVDNIYIRNRSQAIEHLVKNSLGENKTAVILLGGKEDTLKISGQIYRPTAKIKKNTVIESALVKLRENNNLIKMGEKIKCPVIAIHGDYDPHPISGVKEPLSKIIKDFKLIKLKKCGHYPWNEKYAKDTFYIILKSEII